MLIFYRVVPKYFHGLVTAVEIKTNPWGTQRLTLSSFQKYDIHCEV